MSDGREEREDERTRQEQAVKEGRVPRPSRWEGVEPIEWEPERKDS